MGKTQKLPNTCTSQINQVAKLNKNKQKLSKRKKQIKRQNKKYSNTQPSTQPSLNSNVNYKEPDDQMKNHFQPFNKIILSKYGKEILKSFTEMEDARLVTFDNFNDKHLIDFEYKKLLDSLDQAIHYFKLSDETFFLTSYIIDTYLNQTSALPKDLNEFKLIGLTSFYIASKMVDLHPFRVTEICNNIGMNLFSSEEIIDKEIEIVNSIDFDFHIISTYDMIHVMFCDCITYSQDKINSLELKDTLSIILNYCILLAKFIESDKLLIKIKTSLKAIVCIVVAFDLCRSISNKLSNEGSIFIKSWIKLLLDINGYSNDVVCPLYNRIKDEYVKETNKRINSKATYYFEK